MTSRLLVLTLLVLPASGRAQVFSPGKLARGHASLDAKCTACHETTRGPAVARLCLDCHVALDQRIRARAGFHGRRDDVRQCSRCHKEHKGRDYRIVDLPSRNSGFDHRTTGYPLRGKHGQIDCRRCHRPALQRVAAVKRLKAARRRRTYLGLSRDCAACHRDVHRKEAGSRCADCHDERAFKPVERFPGHDKARFTLAGAHQKVACTKCHKKKGDSLRFKGLTFSRCNDCHRSVHRKTMGQGAASPAACRSCHVVQSWKKMAYTAASHPSRVPLRGGHARAACARCHGRRANGRPKGTRCVSCHQTPHREVKFGNNCSRCHGLQSWRVGRGQARGGPVPTDQKMLALAAGVSLAKVKSVAFHNQTRFPLNGRHALVSCDRCHRKGLRRGQRNSRKFSGRFDRCEDCHEDEHRGQFARRQTGNAELVTRCESCHRISGLATTAFSLEDHQRSRFPLKGAHRAVACDRCHDRRRPPSRRFTFDRRRCGDCHRDPHRGKFKLAAAGREPLSCDACHVEQSFDRPRFTHDKTRLPLRGRHARLRCGACHRPDAAGEVVFDRLDFRCGSCHRDRHQGQFARGGRRRGCGDCHDEESFKIRQFDHRRLAGLALSGGHRQAKCADCHHEVALADGRQVTLYRLPSKACKDCHQSRHGELARRLRARLAPQVRGNLLAASAGRLPALSSALVDRCDNCHDPAGWRRVHAPKGDFDHRLVGYALRGRHRSASCNACHRESTTIGRQCSNCHEDRHQGRMGRRCAECHTPGSWRVSRVIERHRRTRLPLTGTHALTDCSSCHPRSREAVYRGVPAACYGCHAEQYRDPTIHPNHVQSGFSQRCEQCHRPTGWRPATFNSSSAALGVHRRFPLSGRHAQQPCVACHDGRRPSRSCVGCHADDRERGPGHRAAGFPADCRGCHGERQWRPALGFAHQRFPLTGKHRGLDCTDCHIDSSDFRRFSCSGSCHRPRSMATRHTGVAGFVQADAACRRCHPSGQR